MSEMLLINPRARRRRRKNPTAAQKRARAAFARMARARSANPKRRRRRNPAAPVSLSAAPRRRRRNPSALGAYRSMRRRRRNPAVLSTSGIMAPIQNALVQGAGAVAFDVVHAQIGRYLPAALQPTPGQIGLGDAAKAILTVILGRALRGPTRGLSMRAATGALTVQSYGLIRSFVPAGMGLGYASPAMIGAGNNRIGPSRGINASMGRFVPGAPQLLQRYDAPGGPTPMLNGTRSARAREGVTIR